MDGVVWVALITSFASLLVALGSVWMQQRGARLEREEARRSEAKVVLDRYRGSLLSAAWDLGDRIDNIRFRGFLSYSAKGSGRESAAKLTTMFRFAQYFGWREVLRNEVRLLKFETEDTTRHISDLLSDIRWAFASDRLDDSRGMLWQEEQRAIGELLRVEGRTDQPNCKGYATFAREYDDTFRPWMDGLAQDVFSDAEPVRDRLRLLNWALFGLVVRLDEEHVHVADDWLNRARDELNSSPPGEQLPRVEVRIRNHLAVLLPIDGSIGGRAD